MGLNGVLGPECRAAMMSRMRTGFREEVGCERAGETCRWLFASRRHSTGRARVSVAGMWKQLGRVLVNESRVWVASAQAFKVGRKSGCFSPVPEGWLSSLSLPITISMQPSFCSVNATHNPHCLRAGSMVEKVRKSFQASKSWSSSCCASAKSQHSNPGQVAAEGRISSILVYVLAGPLACLFHLIQGCHYDIRDGLECRMHKH